MPIRRVARGQPTRPDTRAGIANQYCSPSFETAASRPPQDEV